MINLAPLTPDFPVLISEDEYAQLIKRTNLGGWSFCGDQREWLAKLHYLRKGYKENKIGKEAFFTRERQLTINWWYRFT